MGTVVSTFHGAIKFHTTEGIGTVFSTYEFDTIKEGMKKVRETPPVSKKGVFSCVVVEEKVFINDKYPEQTITIEKQLPEHFKGRLQDLLRGNADVFAWTHADMIGIPRTIMVEGKSFNTEHKLSEYRHVKTIKQKRRGMGLDRSTAALMLIDPEGKEYTYAPRFRFETTNSEAEYEALFSGLRIAQDMEITILTIFVDSQLLVNQIKGTYAPKQPTIREYLQKTKEALKGFHNYATEHIRRNQNKKADALSKLASMTFEHLTKEVLIEVLSKMSIEEKEILQVETKEGERWMTPIHEYLVHRTLPRNSQKETLFSLTYSSAAIILIFENNVAKDDRGRIEEVDKRRESKEVASIEDAQYQNKLRRTYGIRVAEVLKHVLELS
uniref:Reverse transcriptase domain-containing protein n=1 Tax=Tanacetum cinerariifolium TaxID=118510 RepID=A0A6L2J4G3_TANCI|nr:reverse transcriptase domain-containing protein [Tanacetum cinerariifolium]